MLEILLKSCLLLERICHMRILPAATERTIDIDLGPIGAVETKIQGMIEKAPPKGAYRDSLQSTYLEQGLCHVEG